MNMLRPLSPHLSIYKPQLTSTFPISHRISGALLATLVLFFYLLCLKIGLICFTYEKFYKFFFFSSKLILISVEITALALSYHLYNGVRHLLTDLGGFFFLRIGRKRLKWLFQISPDIKAFDRIKDSLTRPPVLIVIPSFEALIEASKEWKREEIVSRDGGDRIT